MLVLLQNIKNKLDSVDERFSFSVKVKMNKSDYTLASIFDIRKEKISENTLSKEAFHEKVFLNENNEKDMHRSRKGFFLVTGREEHRGYMSAGSTMLDCAPNNILAYFGRPKKGEAVWGMYHEYGHLYEQGWGFTEYWNNMFANAKTRIDKNDPTWSWAYGNKQQYEETKVVPSYSDYLTKGEQYKRIVPMYFFLAFIDSIDNEFMQKLETFWREEGKFSFLVSDDKPKLFFKRYKDEVFLRVEFDFINKKFIASLSGVAANVHHHSSEYIVIEHYNKKNKLKNRYFVNMF
ncbi:MAG: M60 family metallopeptidase [Cetobacterium sp.]|uniref:M60 family metallopeptidase n=1 Tax=Cetobacterium sp. TaxID=2071632 RepID=UPI003F3553AC